MKFIDEYRDAGKVLETLEQIRKVVTRRHTLMEICGGQTHTIVKYGLDTLLPDEVRLIHGPGCPVCVTPLEMIDMALELAARPDVILCSFGDMLRVPGSEKDLFAVKAEGGRVRIVYSPLDALTVAQKNPDAQVVFFSVGFETTAPATAMAVRRAKEMGLENFSLLVSHVLVPPAIDALLSAPDNEVQGFLAAGHVCTIMGYEAYHPLAEQFQVPIVVTGFEPLDIVQGVLLCVQQLEDGRAEVENQYARSVREEGNLPAREMLAEVFRVVHRKWRGMGEVPSSGLGLTEAYAAFDAERKLGLEHREVPEPKECLSGEVLKGKITPEQCPAFGKACTPERPLGAPMVSSEGACAAYYLYRSVGDRQEV